MSAPARRPLWLFLLLALVAAFHITAAVALAQQPPAPADLVARAPLQLLGLFALAVSLVVWWRFPRDAASAPLLLLALLFSLSALIALPRPLALLCSAATPLLGPAALLLAASFTGTRGLRLTALLLRAALALALLLAPLVGLAYHLAATHGPAWLVQAAVIATSGHLALCLGGVIWIVLRASGPPSPAIFRYRARVLARIGLLVPLAVGLDAVIPPLLGVELGLVGTVLLKIVPLALVPLGVGLVIARRPLSDLADLVRRRPRRWAESLTVLLRARTVEELAAALRSALVETWRLTQAHLVLKEWGHRADSGRRGAGQPGRVVRLRRVQPGKVVLDGAPPDALPLPEQFAPGEFAPVTRALTAEEPIAAWDPETIEAQTAPATESQDRRGEAHFWTHYGVETIVPLRQEAETVGLLLLGPRDGGRPLGAAQLALLPLLAELTTAALESVRLLSRLEQEATGLEQRAAARAEELTGTRADLETIHGQLMEAKMQAMLGRLIAGIVHEMNTPLGTLGSSVDTLRRAIQRYRPYVAGRAGDRDAEATRALRAIDAQEQLLSVMEASRERLSAVLARLQRFVALDAAEVAVVDVCASLDDVLTLLAPDLGERIAVVRSYADPPPRVRCAPARLSQVFLNLLQNAVDAIEGRGEIRVSVEPRGKRVAIEVSDSGRGIAQSRLDGILEFAFTIKTDQRVGLRTGLPACKKSVVEMGGRLSITSAEGQGTTVVVELPLAT